MVRGTVGGGIANIAAPVGELAVLHVLGELGAVGIADEIDEASGHRMPSS